MQDSAEGLICTPVPPGATFFDELADVLLQRNHDLLESGDLSPLRVLVPALPMAVELRTALLRAAGGGVAGGNSEGLAPRMLNTSIKNDASSVIGNGNSLAPLRSSGYGESSFRHHQPLSFGIAVRMAVMSIVAGN